MVEGSEARKFPRIPFEGTVYLNDTEEETDGDGVRACDLSLGGLSVLCFRTVGMGREVDLDFLERNVRVRGVTRHEAPGPRATVWRIGIQFSEPQPELVEVILSLVKE
jgi:hypothetical protein